MANRPPSDISQNTSYPQKSELRGDITRAAMEDFHHLFEMFDQNGDGTIDLNEFEEIIRMLGEDCPSKDKLDDMIRVACGGQQPDPKGLTFTQFMNFFAIFKQDWPVDVSDDDIFNVLDEDGGTTISPVELRKVLTRFGMRISEDEANAMADLATPFPGRNEIRRLDMIDIAKRVRELRNSREESPQSETSDD